MTKNSFDQYRIELLRPGQIRNRIHQGSIVYIPLGTYEWHGEHLPIGLDSLTAHGLCLRACVQTGGLVCPPLYYGWGVNNFPWTILVPDQSPIIHLIRHTLDRLCQLGVELAVLFTGHFPSEQVEMIEQIARDFNAEEKHMKVLELSVNQAPETIYDPDHAAIFETSLLGAINDKWVELAALPEIAKAPANDPGGDVKGPHRRDPSHPLYGIFGPDPRNYDQNKAEILLHQLVDWLVSQVNASTQLL